MVENRVREYRKRSGISQTELARRIRVASPMVSDFELGKRMPWPRAKRALAKALGVSAQKLFPEDGKAGRMPEGRRCQVTEQNEAEARECLANIICQYLVPEAYQKDTPAKTRAEHIASRLWRLGYRLIRPDDLKVLETTTENPYPEMIWNGKSYGDARVWEDGFDAGANAQLAADKKALGL